MINVADSGGVTDTQWVSYQGVYGPPIPVTAIQANDNVYQGPPIPRNNITSIPTGGGSDIQSVGIILLFLIAIVAIFK